MLKFDPTVYDCPCGGNAIALLAYAYVTSSSVSIQGVVDGEISNGTPGQSQGQACIPELARRRTDKTSFTLV